MATTSDDRGDTRIDTDPRPGPALRRAMDEALDRGEVGLQIAVYRHGELVVDAAAGTVSSGGPAVDRDTVFFVASAGKVSTATALHRQVERGLLEYDQPIASVWPEFAAEGKDRFTVRDALTHREGLSRLPEGTWVGDDWDRMVNRLAASAPSSDPVEREAYHAFTWGYVVGEIARRVEPDRTPFDDLVRTLVHEPLGISGVWHRLPESEHPRNAVVKGQLLVGDPFDFTITEDHDFNTPHHWGRTDPSGAWMTARGGARLWSLYAQGGEVDGVRLLSADRIRTFLEPRDGGQPAGIMIGSRGVIGQGGLMLGGAVPHHEDVLGFKDNVLWHPGGGGAVGFADLDAGISAMICHNEYFDERPLAAHPFAPIVRAIYDDLAG
ncbi:serine hydrolase domain-containing protein (plasmid) [Herbiconiux sp. KACC 21604]|uniref:serine hydrolase domain-containing protein n=1 Tax=unclassified Herbiconiux TaxID=2618217 RepID=UPI001491A493|nr:MULTISPECIES: serine hydrolase domain-containing protein [unclassified Herbiconiux]QJU56311.1 beta-lactamase family protein [Herbiconiux sp. SALV-R1]WPO88818.1 serine hydrolase domain-containing protein [Herbiconiux sp. KACC 21604]